MAEDNVIDLKAERLVREILAYTERRWMQAVSIRLQGLSGLLCALLLGACVAPPSDVVERLDAIDQKLEGETDAITKFAFKRGCRGPVDVLNRNLSTDEMLEGAYLICKKEALGIFIDRMVGVVNRRNDMLKPPAPGTAPMTGS